ncbi:DUF4184 family protein [Empedobacter sedimenti]|uniref:DUF4184 family protein n=1 Tax=Empedobacter sedimenti TaxID=3042610 RepID=UPI0024A68424|nr:DUF4184 family protein [Empedobacter sedimenti]
MPLTFCHPAIVLPLKKLKSNWFSMTGLIIGSMSPDLEYFSRMEIIATHSHLFWGVLYFDLPIALIYCFVFHLFIRNILINHLPNSLKERFSQFLTFDWIDYFKKHWIIMILSIIIGAYSHLFWDAFTHEWGYFVKLIPALQEVWFSKPIEVKGYKFLQHFSTFIGAIFIAFWIYRMPKQTLPRTKFDYIFWLQIILLTTIISTLRFVFFPIEIALGNLIVVIGMSGFISLVILGLMKKQFL